MLLCSTKPILVFAVISLSFIFTDLTLLGRRQANLCFHFAGSGENLQDSAKSRDACMGKKQNSFLFRTASCRFSVEVFPQITNNLSAGDHCQRDIKRRLCMNVSVFLPNRVYCNETKLIGT